MRERDIYMYTYIVNGCCKPTSITQVAPPSLNYQRIYPRYKFPIHEDSPNHPVALDVLVTWYRLTAIMVATGVLPWRNRNHQMSRGQKHLPVEPQSTLRLWPDAQTNCAGRPVIGTGKPWRLDPFLHGGFLPCKSSIFSEKIRHHTAKFRLGWGVFSPNLWILQPNFMPRYDEFLLVQSRIDRFVPSKTWFVIVCHSLSIFLAKSYLTHLVTWFHFFSEPSFRRGTKTSSRYRNTHFQDLFRTKLCRNQANSDGSSYSFFCRNLSKVCGHHYQLSPL